MVNDRKGISSVLTLAFLILGTVIGVSLLWVFVNKNVDRSEEITDVDCFTLDFKLLECKAYGVCLYDQGLGRYNANILVERGVGPGNLTGLRFIFEDRKRAKEVYDQDLNVPSLKLDELSRVKFKDPYSIPLSGEPYLVRIAALLGKKKDVCPVASASQTCSNITSPPPLGSKPCSSPPCSPYEGYCCQWPNNHSQCYDGSDSINYPIDPVTGKLTKGMPPGNITLCCKDNPNP